MGSSDKNQDMSRVVNDLAKQVGKLADSLDGSGRPGSSGGGRAKPKASQEAGLTSSILKDLNKDLKAVDTAINKLQKGATDVTQSHKTLYAAQTDLIKGIVTGGKKTEVQQQKLINKVDDVIKAHSILGVSLANTAKSAEHLNKITEQTGEFLSNYSEILKKAGATSLSNITHAGELEKALKKLSQEMDLGAEVNELIRKKEFDAAGKLVDANAKNAVIVRNDIKKTSNSFNTLVGTTNALKAGMSKAAETVGNGFIKEAMTWGGAMGLIVDGAKQAYTQFKSTASAGFGAEFIKLSGTAISLGISLESLTQITKENMNLVGKMGLAAFNQSLKESQIGLMKLGLSTEEAAKTRAVMNENAMLSGVDVTNKIALNKSTKEQIDTYETLRATTGESIEMIAKQTKSILESNDSMKIMSAMTRQQRVQMLQDINVERARLTTMGLSNEAAMEVVKTVQSMKNEKALTRLDQSNNLQAAGATVGMDAAWTDKIAQITTKSKGSRTADDDKAMADYAAEYNKKSAAMQGNGTDLGQNIVGDYADELAGPIKDLGEKMAPANMSRGMSPEQVEANKAMGRLPTSVAEGSARIESRVQLLESPLTKIAVGVAGVIFLLGKLVYDKIKSGKTPGKLPENSLSNINADIYNKNKVSARPGSSVQGGSYSGSQLDSISRSHGWVPDSEKGFSKINGIASKAEADRRYAATQGKASSLETANSTSLASPALQARLRANKGKYADSVSVDHGQRGLDLPSHGAGGMLSRIGGAVGNGASSAVGKIGGVASKGISAVGSGMGKLAGFGMKAIPFLGLAITGIEALKGAFDAADNAATIFGVDTSKTSVTSAQKISAGIAGALNTLSFGLIPVDGTAKLLNDVAENGAGVITDYIDSSMEFLVNKAIPAIYSGVKSVLGFIGNAILSVFSADTWIQVFTGEGDGGIVGSILRSLMQGIEFLGTALVKGYVKYSTDLIQMIVSKLPAWMVPKSLKDGLASASTWASTDTKVSDTDSPAEAKARADRKAKKDAEAKKAAGTPGANGQATVQGIASDPNNTDAVGMATAFGQQLTADQLKAQGIQGAPSKDGNQTTGVTPAGAQVATDANGTTVNNNTTNTTTAPPKTETETLLSGILDKVTSLVDLTSKGLNITKEVGSASTRNRLSSQAGDNGWSPTMQSFINNIA